MSLWILVACISFIAGVLIGLYLDHDHLGPAKPMPLTWTELEDVIREHDSRPLR